MSTPYRHVLGQPRVTALDMLRVGDAYATLAREMLRRPLLLAEAAATRMAGSAARGLLGPWSPEIIAAEMAEECATLAAGLLAVPAAAAADAAARLDAPQHASLNEIGLAIEGTHPVSTVTRVVLDASLAEKQRRELAACAGFVGDPASLAMPPLHYGAPFLLPARVLDASQAWAVWFVPVEVAWGLLRQSVELGHQPAAMLDAFAPVEVGAGAAMVSLLASDYRASDFGVTQEIALTLAVCPARGSVSDPGQIFLRLVVTDAHSIPAARQIWGIRKDFRDSRLAGPAGAGIAVGYGADRVRFRVGEIRPSTVVPPRTLELGFPRFGAGRSAAMPSVVYSMVEPHGLPAGPEAPARSMLRRDGAGEGMQYGGAVTISLPACREEGMAAGCLCAGGMACLCDTLRGLGLADRPPAANGWTEHMACELEEPVPLLPQEPGNSRA